jgi:hypothetical protein
MGMRSEKYASRSSMMQEVLGTITMKSVLLMALLTVALAAQAESPKPDIDNVLKAISEQMKPLFVSEHNLAEMRGGEESAHVDDVLTITLTFRRALDPAFFVGGLVAKMRLPEDAETVRRTFYITAENMAGIADASIRDVNESMADLRSTAAKVQAGRIRDAMIAIRGILRALPKNDKQSAPR